MTEYIYNIYMNTNMNLIKILHLSSFLGLYLDENFNVLDNESLLFPSFILPIGLSCKMKWPLLMLLLSLSLLRPGLQP